MTIIAPMTTPNTIILDECQIQEILNRLRYSDDALQLLVRAFEGNSNDFSRSDIETYNRELNQICEILHTVKVHFNELIKVVDPELLKSRLGDKTIQSDDPFAEVTKPSQPSRSSTQSYMTPASKPPRISVSPPRIRRKRESLLSYTEEDMKEIVQSPTNTYLTLLNARRSKSISKSASDPNTSDESFASFTVPDVIEEISDIDSDVGNEAFCVMSGIPSLSSSEIMEDPHGYITPDLHKKFVNKNKDDKVDNLAKSLKGAFLKVKEEAEEEEKERRPPMEIDA